MAVATRTLQTRPFPIRARRWARENLFSGAWNTLLTIVSVVFVGYLVFALTRFVVVQAEWDVVLENRRLIFLWRYPRDEEWRIWPSIWLLGTLAGTSMGLWSRVGWRGALLFALSLAFVFGFLAHGENGLRLAAAVVLAVAGYAYAQRARGGAPELWLRRIVIAGWAALVPLALVLLLGFGGVRPTHLGGFLLNVVLAAVAIEAALPLGVLLALARASSLPVVKVVATAYIETIRGAPLIAWLFVAWFVLPGFLPPIFNIDRMDLMMRAMLMLSIFTSAYIAEIVRGGLQSIPRGQYEAAHALGLGTVSITVMIVLPQALRAVIPALVSQLISLWKDTSLVSILPLMDGLGASEVATAQRDFFGRQREVLLFAALVFWAGAYTMSRLSVRLERALGVGTR
jgi:general L-amino acid transport system permease protein